MEVLEPAGGCNSLAECWRGWGHQSLVDDTFSRSGVWIHICACVSTSSSQPPVSEGFVRTKHLDPQVLGIASTRIWFARWWTQKDRALIVFLQHGTNCSRSTHICQRRRNGWEFSQMTTSYFQTLSSKLPVTFNRSCHHQGLIFSSQPQSKYIRWACTRKPLLLNSSTVPSPGHYMGKCVEFESLRFLQDSVLRLSSSLGFLHLLTLPFILEDGNGAREKVSSATSSKRAEPGGTRGFTWACQLPWNGWAMCTQRSSQTGERSGDTNAHAGK